MSLNNGVIRIGKKGLVQFAFNEDGKPFTVDVVVAFYEWVSIDEQFRERTDDRSILPGDMPKYHDEAVLFAKRMATDPLGPGVEVDITTAQALDFIARLREQYDEVAVFFRPKLKKERESPDTSVAELKYSEEES